MKRKIIHIIYIVNSAKGYLILNMTKGSNANLTARMIVYFLQITQSSLEAKNIPMLEPLMLILKFF